MHISNEIKNWIESRLNSTIECLDILSINQHQKIIKVQLTDKSQVVVKFSESQNQKRIDAEVQSLLAIENEVSGFSAKVLASCDKALILSYYPPKSPDKKHWQQLGERLAQLHQQTYSRFGFNQDNYCGESFQLNTYSDHGIEFFAENRLKIQIQRAYQNNLFDSNLYESLLKLTQQLNHWIPDMPAVLIHGDLWSGNQLSTELGAKLIDPACYYGWAEADLAMTKMFAGFDQNFYQAYEYHSEIGTGWLERIPLYNLYHQLNHLNIFGVSYLSGIVNTVKSYIY